MDKLENRHDTTSKRGFIDTTEDGTQYFVMGKIRIKISEHFANNGNQLGSLLEDVIQHAAVAS